MTRRRIIALTACLATLAGRPAAAQEPHELRIAPERTQYRETTRYHEVAELMQRLAERSPVIHLDTFGYTMEGRALPLAVVGRVPDASPESVRAAGRTVVYLQGNIHGGEVEGKEALLMLLRDVAEGTRHALLDSLVLLIAPIYNADGNERIALTNRPAQHGPIGGMGRRTNAQDLDLNRDHMKLESPEARSLARMLNRYDPHVSIDLHATNGTRHAYHLTYSPPLHPSTPSAIVSLLRDGLLPAVTQTIRERDGWDLYYYGNVFGEGETRGWYTFDHRPRFNTNYIGLRNRFAILSEAYAYLTFEDRIRATTRFVDEILAWTHAHATRIRDVTAAADDVRVRGQRLALRATFERSTGTVPILMGDVVEERNPYSGAVMLRRAPTSRVDAMHEYGTFAPTETDVAPAAYILLEPVPAVLANLQAHGIRFAPLGVERRLAAEAFRVDSTSVASRTFQGHRERTVFGAWEATTVQAPAPAVLIPVDQPLGRLIFTLLEPRSDDGLVNWNFFDAALDAGHPLPLLRVHSPVD